MCVLSDILYCSISGAIYKPIDLENRQSITSKGEMNMWLVLVIRISSGIGHMDKLPVLFVHPAIKTIHFHWVSPDFYPLLIFLYFFVANVAKVLH